MSGVAVSDPSATVDGLAQAKLAHFELIREYVDVLVHVANREAAGHGVEGANLVRSHIKRRLGELETAYVYRRQPVADDSAAATWYDTALESVRELSATLPSHSAWRAAGRLASHAWKAVAAVVGLLTLDRLLELRKHLRGVSEAVGDWISGDLIDFAGPAVVALVAVPLHSYIRGFYEKRRVLLGNDQDLQVVRTASGARPDGRNAYELEDALFAALGFVKRRETQLDKDFLWTVVVILFMVWWVPFFFSPPWYFWLLPAAFLLLTLFVHSRAGKRKWA